MSRELYNDMERMRISAGHKSQRELLVCMISLNRWALRKLDEGRIIAAIDPVAKSYIQLEVDNIFPNLKETGRQDIETDFEGE